MLHSTSNQPINAPGPLPLCSEDSGKGPGAYLFEAISCYSRTALSQCTPSDCLLSLKLFFSLLMLKITSNPIYCKFSLLFANCPHTHLSANACMNAHTHSTSFSSNNSCLEFCLYCYIEICILTKYVCICVVYACRLCTCHISTCI